DRNCETFSCSSAESRAFRTLTIRSTVAVHWAGVRLRLAGERSSWHEPHFACQSGRYLSSALLVPASTVPVNPVPVISSLLAPSRLAQRSQTSTAAPAWPP